MEAAEGVVGGVGAPWSRFWYNWGTLARETRRVPRVPWTVNEAERQLESSSDSTASAVGGVWRDARPRRRRAILALVVTAVLALTLTPVNGADAVVLPQADVRLTGTVGEGPDPGGVDTNSTMEYRLTVRNEGPNPIPAGGLLLVLFVDRAEGTDRATIEVARFSDDGGLRPAPGGDCGNGRRLLVQCTNRQNLEAGQEINLRIGHRHPSAEAGTLSFVAEVSVTQPTLSDPVPGDNSYRGPNYQLRNQPPTTTTSTTTPTTTESSTTTDPSSTTTTDPNGSSTTVESTTTTSESTTTSSSTTSTTSTTTLPSTTTTLPSTTGTETSLAALSGSATLPAGPTTLQLATDSSSEGLVLGESGGGPTEGGPPYLLLAALLALVVLIGGVGTALYAHLNRPPPLVDMRTFD